MQKKKNIKPPSKQKKEEKKKMKKGKRKERQLLRGTAIQNIVSRGRNSVGHLKRKEQVKLPKAGIAAGAQLSTTE